MIGGDGLFDNTVLDDLPELPDPAAVFEALFRANEWPSCWRNGIFGFHHYHSTAHEVLAIARGEAAVRLGGEAGITLDVGPGDVMILPAGVGQAPARIASRKAGIPDSAAALRASTGARSTLAS